MSRTVRIAQIAVSVAARLVLAAALAALLVAGSTVVRVWQVARQDHRPVSDAIVVLGSAQYDGRPSAVLEARLQHALALYQQGVSARVVTVGGRRAGDRFTEAGTGRTWLVNHGVPATAVAYPSARSPFSRNEVIPRSSSTIRMCIRRPPASARRPSTPGPRAA